MKKLLILLYILFPYILFSQTKDSLNLRSLVYKSDLIQVKTKYTGSTKLRNQYLNYDIDYGYSTFVKALIPISVKHKKFKLMGNISYFKENFRFNNFEVKDNTAEHLKLIPKHVEISGEKLLTSLRLINILNVFDKTVVLTTNLNSYTNSDWEFKKLTGMFIVTVPIKTESKYSSFSVGMANLLREDNQYIAFPIISYNKLYSNNYLLSAIFPYKFSFSKIYSPDFTFGVGAKLGTDWPLVDVEKSNYYGSNKDLIMSNFGIDIGFEVEKRLNKYIVFSAETGISNVFRSEMQDENRNELVENDPYRNFYFGITLGIRIKR